MYPSPLSLGRRIVKLGPEIWVVHAETPIHIQYERFLSGIGGGDDAIAIGYLSGNRCHVARDDMIAISASNVVG